MGRKNFKAVILLLFICIASCKKDKPVTNNILPGHSATNVYVVCEGNYGNGDATLYLYQPAKDSVYGDIYQKANGGTLGDVFQSMQHIGHYYFLCINNSDKVVAINDTNWLSVVSLSIPQPRYILPISSNKAYVSTLYSKKVYIINPEALTVTGNITIPSLNAESMCLQFNNAFICSWDTADNKIYQVDVTSDALIRTIPVAGYAPQEVLIDKEQMLWVLAGDQPQGRIATFTRIDPSTGEILASYTFPAAADPLKPVFNNTKDTLYYIEDNNYGGTDNNGIYRMNIHDVALPAIPFIPAVANQYFWALGIDPATGNIYVGDPKGFVQRGSVSIYKADATKLTTFTVGLGPGHFYFDY